MKTAATALIAAFLLTGTALPSVADDLLGGLLGGSGDSSLVTLSSGSASDSGLVNVGLGGGDGNVVDLNVGGSSAPIADVNASIGGSGGGINVGANVLQDTVTANVGVGGSGGLLNVDAGLLGGTITANVGIGGGGGSGSSGNPGNGNNPGNSSNPGNVANGGGNVIIGHGGNVANSGGSRNSNTMPACAGESANSIVRLIRSTRIDSSWQRSSGVQVQRVALCPDVQVWLSTQLQGSGLGPQLQSAIMSDPLLSASLNRTSYSADRVFAVRQSGSQLTIFVY